jgi:hypothetical protein
MYLLADVTNTPVWWLFGATLLLATVTGVLAVAAFRALQQLSVAVEQLEEVKRDRHVQVFIEMGRRWEGREMTEALVREIDYAPDGLVRLTQRAAGAHTCNPIARRRKKRAGKELTVLLRVPNYFEDVGTLAKAGTLEAAVIVEAFGGVAADEWRVWGPAVKKLQETDPKAYEEFERLAKESD